MTNRLDQEYAKQARTGERGGTSCAERGSVADGDRELREGLLAFAVGTGLQVITRSWTNKSPRCAGYLASAARQSLVRVPSEEWSRVCGSAIRAARTAPAPSRDGCGGTTDGVPTARSAASRPSVVSHMSVVSTTSARTPRRRRRWLRSHQRELGLHDAAWATDADDDRRRRRVLLRSNGRSRQQVEARASGTRTTRWGDSIRVHRTV